METKTRVPSGFARNETLMTLKEVAVLLRAHPNSVRVGSMKVFSRATVWDLAGIEDLDVKICSNFWVHEHMKHIRISTQCG